MYLTQVYSPVAASLGLSALVAALPVVGVAPVLAAANSAGDVMGKMIDAQSIVVAGVVTGPQGQEGSIPRYVFLRSVALASLVGVVVFSMAYVFPWMIPVVTK
jgi:lactate permease